VSRGWWTLGKFGGAPIRLHWSLPLGALLWSGFSFAPAFWLAFAGLILVHELGHALVVLRYRLGLSEIAVHGAGGYCQHRHSGTRFEEAAVAWGGVLAQLALFIAVQVAVAVFGPPGTVHTRQAYYVFTNSNLWLIFINLIPVEPLDGAKAWPLVRMLLSRFRGPQRQNTVFERRRSVEDELRDLERMNAPNAPATPPRNETPSEKTDRIVRELIARTTQPKDR
jgi:stage IV sporulation protein FB